MSLSPFLYIHFPWCVRKCPYCDFNSHELKGELPEERYISTLIKDFDNDCRRHELTHPIQGIFLGGGTPSLFSGRSIQRLLGYIRSRQGLANQAEITMEVNPGAVEHDRFEHYLEAGINRLSFGAQSFSDTKLHQLGRIHSADDIPTAIRAAKGVGFDNFNIDLMYGLPRQKTEEAIADCEKAIDLGPAHLSLYQLTLEPNTLFHKFPPALPDQEELADMQSALIDLTTENQFRRYEVSAYAKPAKESRHNLNYWNFGDYLGIGAGAHSKITKATNERFTIERGWKEKHPRRYTRIIEEGSNALNTRNVPMDDVLFEFCMNALRLKQGFSLSQAELSTGYSSEDILAALRPAMKENRIIRKGDIIRCEEKGYLFLDDILVDMLPDPTP